MKILYFDCFSGAAGDMILGALLDAGASEAEVRDALASLDVDGWALELRPVRRGSIEATKADVVITGDQKSRGPAQIREILQAAALPDPVRARALRIFELLTRAEARVHGVAEEDVHFHEVGALDALVDVVGCAAALHSIRPERIVSSPLTTGRGWTDTAHGRLPVPAPAVVELLAGVPVEERGTHELVTPTGAAILVEAVYSWGVMPALTLRASGYGAGGRDLDVPNVVRVLVGDSASKAADPLIQIEANIDDMSPELIPHVIERLLSAGAADAWVTTALMKKGRPGYVLAALTAPENRARVIDVFLRETTTFGVRMHEVERAVLDRSWVEVEVEGHPMRVKLGRRGDTVTTAAPEHDDALKVARASGLPLKEVYALALEAARSRSPQ